MMSSWSEWAARESCAPPHFISMTIFPNWLGSYEKLSLEKVYIYMLLELSVLDVHFAGLNHQGALRQLRRAHCCQRAQVCAEHPHHTLGHTNLPAPCCGGPSTRHFCPFQSTRISVHVSSPPLSLSALPPLAPLPIEHHF